MPGRVDANLARLGITIPAPVAAVANYVPYTYVSGVLHLSGQIAKDGDKLLIGQLGKDVTVAEGQKAARVCGINIISQLKAALGDLDRVLKIVKINCFVNSTSDFTQHPAVANGCSDLLVSVFGEEVGRHARCAVGVAQLPLGVAVEIDAMVEIKGHPKSNI